MRTLRTLTRPGTVPNCTSMYFDVLGRSLLVEPLLPLLVLTETDFLEDSARIYRGNRGATQDVRMIKLSDARPRLSDSGRSMKVNGN